VADAARPAPILTDDNAAFWDAARDHRLVAQRCTSCGRLRHPPRPMCPHCRSLDVELVELSGDGTVYSFSIIHHPPTPYFDYPVLAVLVDLDEGIRLVSNLVGVDAASIDGTSLVGARVTVDWVSADGDAELPVFRLSNDGPG
jgi:3-oxo-4,17-pregnadiene-20-carboxyl-CoA hydratase alpha subunit